MIGILDGPAPVGIPGRERHGPALAFRFAGPPISGSRS